MRFWGHDGAFEVCFFVERSALSRLSPGAALDEASMLHEFDRYRDRILEVANKAYQSRKGRDAYTLARVGFLACPAYQEPVPASPSMRAVDTSSRCAPQQSNRANQSWVPQDSV